MNTIEGNRIEWLGIIGGFFFSLIGFFVGYVAFKKDSLERNSYMVGCLRGFFAAICILITRITISLIIANSLTVGQACILIPFLIASLIFFIYFMIKKTEI